MKIEILVVEDDEQICRTVKKYLESAGFLVDTCFNGNHALERVYDKTYHLIVLDIMLPGMNGQDLLKEVRKISDAPVLMMTALDDDDSQLRAFSNLVEVKSDNDEPSVETIGAVTIVLRNFVTREE